MIVQALLEGGPNHGKYYQYEVIGYPLPVLTFGRSVYEYEDEIAFEISSAGVGKYLVYRFYKGV